MEELLFLQEISKKMREKEIQAKKAVLKYLKLNKQVR
jgi:hypothetical protein